MEELNNCLSLDAAWVLVAPLEVIKEALLLHLTVEKALESLNFKNRLLEEVVLLEVRYQLALVVLVLVQVVQEAADPIIFVLELQGSPRIFRLDIDVHEFMVC